MLDDFFVRALLAGIGVALVAGPLGCFILWRRMAFFGDAIAHSALLGASIAILAGLAMAPLVFLLAIGLALVLLYLSRSSSLAHDSLRGVLAHFSLALGLAAISLTGAGQIDPLGLMMGDILAVSASDLGLIYGGGAMVLLVLGLIWRDLLADSVSSGLARAEGVRVERARLIFLVLVAGLVAMALKIVGALLISALLIIPAASARHFAASPEAMALYAALIGALAGIGGLLVSLWLDTPSGPSIAIMAGLLFFASLLLGSNINPQK